MTWQPTFRVISRQAGEELVLFLARTDSLEGAEEIGRVRMVAARAAGQKAVENFLVAIGQGMADHLADRPTPPPTVIRKGDLN